MIRPPLSKFRAAGALALAALVAACGGGGGGGLPEPTINLTINVNNQDEVARASFGSSVSAAVGGFAPGSAGSSTSLAVKRAQAAAVLAARKRIAADVSDVFCDNWNTPGDVGVADEVDTDTAPLGQLNVGDGARVTFTNCLSAGSKANGVMTLTITELNSSRLSFAIATSNFSVLDTSTGYTASLDGGFSLSLSGDDTAFTTRMSIGNELVLTADVGPLSDTVTLLRGYVTQATYTPDDFTTRSTTEGFVDSMAAGGTFRISTVQALQQLDEDDYPSSGQLLVQGVNSRLRATVLSARDVLLEVDENGDGTYDRSATVTWASLLGAPV